MLERFDIHKNQFLTKDIVGYHSLYYSGFKTPENPDFLNVLKNTFDNEPVANLHAARRMVENILLADIPSIAEYIKRCSARRSCISVCVPRAKALNTYTSNQLFLKDAIQKAVRQIPIITDGTDVIIRHTNTRTTHLRETVCRVSKCGQEHSNDGERPYPGITKETCHINADMIRDQNVILIDDIYTNGVNIDEDCIQALFDAGAKGVMFYAIAYTRR